MDEKDIMELITSEYSWEQIIYKIIAWEGMDPWNLDLSLLSRSFLLYIGKMEELDFKIPAKYVVIAAVLLRMKSDHIEYLKGLTQQPEELDAGELAPEELVPAINGNGEIVLDQVRLDVPSKRQPVRKIVLTELISALRNALKTDARRTERSARRREQIVIHEDNITERIESLYRKIDSLLARLRDEEVEFSELVNMKSRKEVLDTFVPLVHLDQDKKVHCRQEELFKAIFIRKTSPEKSAMEVATKERETRKAEKALKAPAGKEAARKAPVHKNLKAHSFQNKLKSASHQKIKSKTEQAKAK